MVDKTKIQDAEIVKEKPVNETPPKKEQGSPEKKETQKVAEKKEEKVKPVSVDEKPKIVIKAKEQKSQTTDKRPVSDPQMPLEQSKNQKSMHIPCPHCSKLLNINKLIAEQLKKQAPAPTPPVKPVASEKKESGYTVRSDETGDRVFFVKDGKRKWVKNLETLRKLGFRLGAERSLKFSELNKIPEVDPIDLTSPESKTGDKEIDQKLEKQEAEEEKKETSSKPYKVWS